MGWEAILQLVIMIITMIMEYLGGGTFSGVLHERDAVHHVVQYQCEDVKWAEPGVVRNGRFQGTLTRVCEVEGMDGGGLDELRRHMEAQLRDSAAEVGATQTVHYDGVYEETFPVTLVVDGKGERSTLKGVTGITTDGVTYLSNMFESTETPKSGNGRYLHYVMEGVKVKSTLREGWYRVEMQHRSEVNKPWYVPTSVFRQEVEKAQEARMRDRTEQILNDLADNL